MLGATAPRFPSSWPSAAISAPSPPWVPPLTITPSPLSFSFSGSSLLPSLSFPFAFFRSAFRSLTINRRWSGLRMDFIPSKVTQSSGWRLSSPEEYSISLVKVVDGGSGVGAGSGGEVGESGMTTVVFRGGVPPWLSSSTGGVPPEGDLGEREGEGGGVVEGEGEEEGEEGSSGVSSCSPSGSGVLSLPILPAFLLVLLSLPILNDLAKKTRRKTQARKERKTKNTVDRSPKTVRTRHLTPSKIRRVG